MKTTIVFNNEYISHPEKHLKNVDKTSNTFTLSSCNPSFPEKTTKLLILHPMTLIIKKEINFVNDLRNNTKVSGFVSSLHNLLTNNLKQCKTFETNSKLPLTEKRKSLFILHINIRSIYKNFDALNHEFLQT